MTTAISDALTAGTTYRAATAAQPASASFASLIPSASDGPLRAGRLAMTLTPSGEPSTIVYYAADGTELTRTPVIPSRIFDMMDQFSIPRSDLSSLADTLDAAGVHYKPGDLVHGLAGIGLDLRNMAAGGLGTDFDWTQDSNVALKGPGAAASLAYDKALANRLGLHGLAQDVWDVVTPAPAPAAVAPQEAVGVTTPAADLTTAAIIPPAPATAPNVDQTTAPPTPSVQAVASTTPQGGDTAATAPPETAAPSSYSAQFEALNLYLLAQLARDAHAPVYATPS